MSIENNKKSFQKVRIVLSGYYGFNNCGDEAILLSIIENIEKLNSNIELVVLSNNPKETKSRYNVRSIYRFNPFKLLHELFNCDILVSGGGSLLQDRTSTRSLMYYVWIIKIALFFKKRVILYSNGIGPINKVSNRKKVADICNRVDVITLRERDSYNELKKYNVTNPNIYITADPVFNLDLSHFKTDDNILEKYGIFKGDKVVQVYIRLWKSNPGYIRYIADLCDYIVEKYNRRILFVPMFYPSDKEVSKLVAKIMKHKSFIVDDMMLPQDIINITSKAYYVIGMRLHSLIFAAKSNIPMLGFSYDPKIDAFLETVNMPLIGNTDSFDLQKGMKAIDDLEENYDKYVELLEKNNAICKANAKISDDFLVKLIKEHLNE